MTHAIPVVDLEDLSSPNPIRQNRASEAIVDGFGQYGLIYIQNHGIEDSELTAFYDAFRGFVARPLAEKQKMSKPDIWYQRGWTPPETEQGSSPVGSLTSKSALHGSRALDPTARLSIPKFTRTTGRTMRAIFVRLTSPLVTSFTR
ncbi:MAG: 2-oxoglutarate and iron-dependent oxygenase domain-containing protein [bacterium]